METNMKGLTDVNYRQIRKNAWVGYPLLAQAGFADDLLEGKLSV